MDAVETPNPGLGCWGIRALCIRELCILPSCGVYQGVAAFCSGGYWVEYGRHVAVATRYHAWERVHGLCQGDFAD